MRFIEGLFDDIGLQTASTGGGLLTELENLHLAIDQHSVISITDAAGKITYVNDNFCAASQYPRDELLGQDHRLLNSGVHSKAFFTELWKTIGRRRTWHGEICNRARDGSCYWLDTTIVPLTDQGEITRYVAICTDVTQHKLTAERASAVSSQLQGVLDAASEVSIISTDVRGQITMFNRGAERIFGYRAEEMVGQSCLVLHVPEEIEARRRELNRQFDRELSGFEVFSAIPRRDGLEKRKWTFVRKQGDRLIGELVVTALHSDDGAIIGYLGMTTDITERERAESALRRSEERFHLAVQGSSDGIWDWNLLTGEAYYSPRYKQLLQCVSQEFEDTIEAFRSRLHPDDGQRVWNAIDAHLTGRFPYDVEYRLRTKDNRYRWFRARGQAVWDASGRPTRMAGAITDITGNKLAAEQLRDSFVEVTEARALLEKQTTLLELRNAELAEARQRAEMAAKVKSEFLANMSHEIRTPMTAILGFADILLSDGARQAASEQRKYLETIKRNGEHLLEIINGILDLSKIDAGCMTVERVRCAPCKLVADVSSLMRVRAEAKGLTLTVDTTQPLPETIETDPLRLKQILINLVANAIKFTETGGVSIRVRQRQCDDRSLLEFAVTDTGIGMSQDLVNRLFKPFTQADASATRRFGGTGLGLTISRRFANMLGGDIDVTSAPGQGATFRATVETGDLTGIEVSTPSTDSAPMAATPPSGHVLPATAHTLPGGCRILLAEDGPDNQRLISFVLRKAGGNVTVVENGSLALDAALTAWQAGQPFEVVLMDMQMPVMDGYTATRKLREAGYPGKIIALTAHAMAGDRERCLEAQCDDYATKPIDRQGLVEQIRQHVAPACATL